MGLLDGIINTGTSISQGMIQANAANKAEGAQTNAVSQAQNATTSAYNQGTGYQQPFYNTGVQNLGTLNSMVNSGGYNVNPYNYNIQQAPNAQFNFNTQPGYQFRQQQGMGAINSGASAAGNQLSGATQKALQRYGQNFASNEYQNAFNQFNTNRNFGQQQYEFGTTAGMQNAQNSYVAQNQQANQQYSRQAGLAGMGQQAGNELTNLSQMYGQNMSSLYGDYGNAQAAGIMGQGQAYSNMLGNVGSGLSSMTGGQSQGYGGAGSAQGAFNQTPYGQAYNQSQGGGGTLGSILQYLGG